MLRTADAFMIFCLGIPIFLIIFSFVFTKRRP